MKALIAIAVAVAVIVALSAVLRSRARQRRREALLAKYGDEGVVDMIMSGQLWQGMSQEQLLDSWGSPVAIDDKVYKTKTVQTFKYGQNGRNRFRSRVKVENGRVVGWDLK